MFWIDKNNIVKEQRDIILIIDDICYYNPSSALLKENGWNEYEVGENIEDVRSEKLQEIDNYDTSSLINTFSINGVNMWLNKSTRVGLELRLRAEQEQGLENTTLWFEDIQFTLPINVAQSFLYQLEIYASQCYDNTQLHKKNVNSLNSIQEIKKYDFTQGYPTPLTFNITK